MIENIKIIIKKKIIKKTKKWKNKIKLKISDFLVK